MALAFRGSSFAKGNVMITHERKECLLCLPSTTSRLSVRPIPMSLKKGSNTFQVKPQEIVKMSVSQVRELLLFEGRHLTSSQVRSIRKEYFKSLPLECLSPSLLGKVSMGQLLHIENELFCGMNSMQIRALSERGLLHLPDRCVRVILREHFISLKREQVATLLPKHLDKLSIEEWRRVPAQVLIGVVPEDFVRLAPEYLRVLSAPQVRALSLLLLSRLTREQVKECCLALYKKMSDEQRRVLLSSHLNGMEREVIRKLPGNFFTLLTPKIVSKISPAVLEACTVQQLSYLNSDQIRGFSLEQVMEVLLRNSIVWVKRQVESLSIDVIKGIPAEHLPLIPGGFFRKMSCLQLNSLNRLQVSSLTPQQLAFFSRAQFTCLEGSFFSSLQPKQIKGLDESTQERLILGCALPYLSKEQLRSFSEKLSTIIEFEIATSQERVPYVQKKFEELSERLNGEISRVDDEQVGKLSRELESLNALICGWKDSNVLSQQCYQLKFPLFVRVEQVKVWEAGLSIGEKIAKITQRLHRKKEVC